MNLSPGWLGVIRGLGFVVVLAIIHFLANAANLQGAVGDTVAALIATLALGIEHAIEGSGGGALFGAANKRTY